MPDVLDPELLEERARAERRASLPTHGVVWPTEMPAPSRSPGRAAQPLDPPRAGPPLVGADISHHQGDINVGGLGVRYLWAKATEVGFVDGKFARNRQAASRAGIPFGSYSFLRPGVNVASAVARWATVAAPVHPGDLRPALDIEVPGFTAPEVAAYVREVERVFGCKPVVYIATSIYRQPGMAAAVSGCALWIPRYGGIPQIPFDVHQFTDALPTPAGKVDGNHTDRLDVCLVPGAQPTPTPSPPVEDDMFSDSDRQLLVSTASTVGRLEARGLRQISDPAGVVYLTDGTTRVWVSNEQHRLNMAKAFQFGAPEKWSRSDIDAIPLVGSDAPK